MNPCSSLLPVSGSALSLAAGATAIPQRQLGLLETSPSYESVETPHANAISTCTHMDASMWTTMAVTLIQVSRHTCT